MTAILLFSLACRHTSACYLRAQITPPATAHFHLAERQLARRCVHAQDGTFSSRPLIIARADPVFTWRSRRFAGHVAEREWVY